jgi:hypothetical protein
MDYPARRRPTVAELRHRRLGHSPQPLVTVLLLSRGVLRVTRLTAIAAVTWFVLTWGFAQRPYLLLTR